MGLKKKGGGSNKLKRQYENVSKINFSEIFKKNLRLHLHSV